MAIIIINMDMPSSCYDCKIKRCCKSAHANGWLCNRRDNDCPLKSADEMIAEIEEAKKFWGDCKRTALTIEMEEIIHKYCDKE